MPPPSTTRPSRASPPRRGDADSSCVEPSPRRSTASTAGARSWREVARRGRAPARRRTRRPATATAIASACCSRTGRRSSPTGSRSTRSASASCRSMPTCARPSWSYLVGHSEMCLAVVAAASARRRCARPRARRRSRSTTIRPEVAGRIPPARSPAPLRRPADRPRQRVRAALHLGHDRPARRAAACANGYFLRAGEWYLGLGDAGRGAARRRALHHAAAAQPHERAAFSSMAAILSRRLPRPARPLPSDDLVAERARERRDDRALPRRDAGDAARGAAERASTASTRVRFGFGAGVDRAPPCRRSRSASASRCSRRGR